MYIRNYIDDQMKKGILRKEFSESHLLEIREYHLRLEKYKNDTVRKIDETFKDIISTLKKRKNELITEVLQKFSNERDKIISQEELWTDKQEISERLLSMTKESNDQNILANSKFIMNGMRKLNDKLSFKEIKVYNDLDTSLTIEGKRANNGTMVSSVALSLEEILYYFSQYLTICDPNILEFKS
jgi:hypothetical protein